MKITIITICYNSAKTITRTIESVLSQNYSDLEYLIVDGASKDNTVAIANSYKEKFAAKNISYVISSEPDHGIYDAMNKGINKSTGDVVGILNSDDYYASSDVLSVVANTFESNSVESCYGNILYTKNNKPYRFWKSGKPRTFKFGWMPPHPAFFVKKEIYKKYGGFRLDCGTTADYELMLRLLEKDRITTIWVNKIFTYMEAGGASNAGLESRKKAHNNDKKSWQVNRLQPLKCTLWLKKIRKLPQFITAKFIKLDK